MDKDGSMAKTLDRYAPLMSKYSGYGKRAMEERLKKERNKQFKHMKIKRFVTLWQV